MNKSEWQERYKKRLIESYKIDIELANQSLDAAIEGDLVDYDDNPEDAADEEMSYWVD